MTPTPSTPPAPSLLPPAYVVANVTIKDPVPWQVYVNGVGPTLDPFGGKHLFFGQVAVVYHGSLLSQLVAVLQFPDQTALQNWYSSPAYQELIPFRDQGADVQITSYNGITL